MREDNRYSGTTFLFTYDQNGNITERCEYPYTLKSGEELEELKCTHYSYDYEGDKLKEYNGEAFVYNNLGCPTTYRGKSATWIYGKLLASYNGVQFTYNGLGSRASKGGITFTYDSDGRLIKQSNGLEFIYDNSGVAGVMYANETYFYRKDAQGNIVALINKNGAVVVKYVYDAWGNNIALNANGAEITSGIGVLNPFRYRGYYYDTETELYYLQTRYYDPELGRFISQDSLEYADPETINGLNLYAYCGDNPVMNIDPAGKFAITLTLLGFIIGAVIGATVGGAVAGTIAYKNGARGWELFGWTMLGIVGGGLIGGALGATTGAIITKATGVIGLSITKYSIIPIKSITVLGNMPGYISAATATGSGYYLISDQLWNSLSPAQQWANNMQYILDANSLGSQFALVPDKVVQAGTTFWKEIQLLISKGIPWILF